MDNEILIMFGIFAIFIVGLICYRKGKNDEWHENKEIEKERARLKKDAEQEERISELEIEQDNHSSQIKYLKDEIRYLDTLLDTHLFTKGKK